MRVLTRSVPKMSQAPRCDSGESPVQIVVFVTLPLIEVFSGDLSMQAKTHEKVDALGENRAIACEAVALLLHESI